MTFSVCGLSVSVGPIAEDVFFSLSHISENFVKYKSSEVTVLMLGSFGFIPFFGIPYCFYYYGSVIYLETWIGGFSGILIFFQNSFDYLGVVLVLLKF